MRKMDMSRSVGAGVVAKVVPRVPASPFEMLGKMVGCMGRVTHGPARHEVAKPGNSGKVKR